MKKLWILLAIILMLNFSVFAEVIDFKIMSDESLLALKDSVSEEVEARGLKEQPVIYPGKYYVGKNIKAGDYLFTGLTSKYTYVNIDFYKYDEAKSDYIYLERRSIDLGQDEYITILDGGYFELLFGTATVRTVDISWLIELNNDKEIASTEEQRIIYPGKYYVGKNIKAGDYLFTGLTSKYAYINIDFYKYDVATSDYIYLERRSIDLDQDEYITILDGCYFELLFGTATARTVSIDWLNNLELH